MEEEVLLALQKISEQLEQIEVRTKRIEKKAKHMENRLASPWTKVKRRLKKMSKKKTLLGRILKKLIHFYRISWRYLYCLWAKGKGLQTNKIVFISHKGKQYSCNPMYLCEYLLEHYPGAFEIVWAFNSPQKFGYLKERGIKVVKTESRAHLKHLMTAKIIVTNVDFYIYLPKVKGQIALDTWHGGGAYKTCGFANIQNLKTRRSQRHFKRLYGKVNLYSSSSSAFTLQTIRESRLFQGEVIECGMPRNDILVNRNRPDINAKVREFFDLDEDIKIVLYAPTYRSADELAEMTQLNIEQLISVLTQRFGGTWCCLYRQHHLGALSGFECDNIFPATAYPDMQELLYAADILVSDYSSCIWDFSLQYRPVFLYCPDLNQYASSRDFYMPIEDWHYILARTQEELEKKVLTFNEAEYREGILKHHQELGSFESGDATKIICERLCKECIPEYRES